MLVTDFIHIFGTSDNLAQYYNEFLVILMHPNLGASGGSPLGPRQSFHPCTPKADTWIPPAGGFVIAVPATRAHNSPSYQCPVFYSFQNLVNLHSGGPSECYIVNLYTIVLYKKRPDSCSTRQCAPISCSPIGQICDHTFFIQQEKRKTVHWNVEQLSGLVYLPYNARTACYPALACVARNYHADILSPVQLSGIMRFALQKVLKLINLFYFAGR